MPDNPLIEVFGYPVADMSQEARSHRLGRLCPFGNPSGPNCTKTSATDPLGVYTIRNGTDLRSEAEMAWFVYDLEVNGTTGRYQLDRSDVRYTRFETALNTISVPVPGEMSKFMNGLESRIKKGRFNGAPSSSLIEPSVEPQTQVWEDEAR